MDEEREIWIDKGRPGCEGSPVWTRVNQTSDGRLGPWMHWTCPDCSLDWYSRTS